MNFGEGIEIDDSSLALIALTIIIIVALFTNHIIAGFGLGLLAARLFLNELKAIANYVANRFVRTI